MTQTGSENAPKRKLACSTPGPFNPSSAEGLESFATLQKHLFDNLGSTSSHRFDRARREPSLACTLASRLSAARSFPEAMTAYQDWTTRRFEMMAEAASILSQTPRSSGKQACVSRRTCGVPKVVALALRPN